MILQSLPEIRAAVSTMNPVARLAAQTFGGILIENPALGEDMEKVREACQRAIVHAFTQSYNVDDPSFPEAFMNFVNDHAPAIWDVGVSIALYAAKEQQRKQTWGWLGTAAAVGVGAILGAIFS